MNCGTMRGTINFIVWSRYHLKTEMSRKFHLRNGAFTLSENEETDNYEYELYET